MNEESDETDESRPHEHGMDMGMSMGPCPAHGLDGLTAPVLRPRDRKPARPAPLRRGAATARSAEICAEGGGAGHIAAYARFAPIEAPCGSKSGLTGRRGGLG